MSALRALVTLTCGIAVLPLSLFSQIENVNPAALPEPDSFLRALSANDAFSSRLAQGQAIRFMESVLNEMSFDAISAGQHQPQIKVQFDQLAQEFDAKMRRYSNVRQQIFQELDEPLRSELARPPPDVRLYVIDTILPTYYRESKAASIEVLRKRHERAVVRAKLEQPLYMAATAVLIGVFILALLFTLASLWDRRFAVHAQAKTGQVLREQKRSETTVRETIREGMPNAYGHRTGGGRSVSSSTKRFQEIFIGFENGEEMPLEFEDHKFPCREGNVLSIVYLSRGDSNTSLETAYHNHNTDLTRFTPGAINQALRPEMSRGSRICWWAVTVGLPAFYVWLDGGFDDGVGLWEAVGIGVAALVLLGIVSVVFTLLAKIRTSFRSGKAEREIAHVISQRQSELQAG